MLKIKTEHFYGSQENYDLQLVRLKLNTENLYEKEALENGWLIAYDEWYACRSVRLNIEEYMLSTRKPDLTDTIEVKWFWHTQIDDEMRKTIRTIANEFSNLKGFEWEYDIFSDFQRSCWLIIYDEGIPVAVTKMIRYDGGVESQFTVWNYHKPKISLGKHIVYYEVQAAYNNLNIRDYLYIGQGYERGSMYKAAFNGFEWWTGTEWSNDKTTYEKICARDSTINTLQDLALLYKGKD